MKKVLILTVMYFTSINLILSQGNETFTNCNAAASYGDGSFLGDNSVTWNFVQSRDESSYVISGKGLILRRVIDNSSVKSSVVLGGIGNFSCNLKKAFTGVGNRQVELFINGVSKGTSVAFDNTTVQTFSISGIKVTGNVVIEIKNITANQITIDDIVWTSYSAPLFVDFKSFSVSKNNAKNILAWQTASEKNNAQFNIENSADGESFFKIGETKGKGNSTIEQNYSFTDANPLRGINYYRLKQVDFDGATTFSKIVSIDNSGKGQSKVKVYPSITDSEINVELNDLNKAEISIRDLSGRILFSKNTEGVTNQILDLSSFVNGLYFLSVRTSDAIETVKIQKH
jgi:Secretion system C-terminal sorting domain